MERTGELSSKRKCDSSKATRHIDPPFLPLPFGNSDSATEWVSVNRKSISKWEGFNSPNTALRQAARLFREPLKVHDTEIDRARNDRWPSCRDRHSRLMRAMASGDSSASCLQGRSRQFSQQCPGSGDDGGSAHIMSAVEVVIFEGKDRPAREGVGPWSGKKEGEMEEAVGEWLLLSCCKFFGWKGRCWLASGCSQGRRCKAAYSLLKSKHSRTPGQEPDSPEATSSLVSTIAVVPLRACLYDITHWQEATNLGCAAKR